MRSEGIRVTLSLVVQSIVHCSLRGSFVRTFCSSLGPKKRCAVGEHVDQPNSGLGESRKYLKTKHKTVDLTGQAVVVVESPLSEGSKVKCEPERTLDRGFRYASETRLWHLKSHFKAFNWFLDTMKAVKAYSHLS